ncbi:MAG: alpha/beta fold hydrolase [Myxococcota bacterium]|nr:alpha/beta fold hydrolase [Myxococcota bacterium]
MKVTRLDLGGFELAVHEVGEGPVVALGHSLTFDHQMFQHQVTTLAQKHRVLLFDLHGQGQSGAPEEYFTLDDIADDLDRALEMLGAKEVCWLGHSMGGMVGMRLAIRHPQRVGALVLMNTSAEAEPREIQDLYHHVNEGSRGLPSNKTTVDFLLGLMFSAGFRESQPERVAFFEDQLYNPPNPEGVYFAAHAVIWRDDVRESLASIDVPALIISAEDDSSVPPKHQEKIAEHLPGSRLVRIASCGHLSPVEQPGVVLGHIDEFLSKHWGTDE